MRRLLLRLGIGLCIVIGVGIVGFAWSGSPIRRLALDDQTSSNGDPDEAYFVELGLPPNNQVLVTRDLTAETRTPLFGVPELSAVYSVAVSPDRDHLVLAYAQDYNTRSTGLYRLDLQSIGDELVADNSALQPLTAEVPEHFFSDLRFAPDGTVLWATVEGPESSSVVGIDVATGDTIHEISSAVSPAPGDGWVAYLPLEEDDSRRAIDVLDLESETVETIDVLDGRYDLGNLIADLDRNRLLMTALIPPGEDGLQIGEPAGAHGAHDGPAQWLTIDVDGSEARRLLDHEPMGVRNATLLSNGDVLATTTSGVLWIGDDVRPASSAIVTTVAG